MNAPSLNGCHNDQRCDQVMQAVDHASAARYLASLSTGLSEPAWPKERMATRRGLAQSQLWGLTCGNGERRPTFASAASRMHGEQSTIAPVGAT
jgi:hypothetical protein